MWKSGALTIESKLAMLMRTTFARLLNLLLHNRPAFRLLGRMNRRWGFLSTVFVMYPATEEYAKAYVPLSKREIMRWSPWLVGFYRQGGKVGLAFVISSTEEQFRDAGNIAKLQKMVDQARQVCDLVGASQLSFAGILPGVLNTHRIVKGSVEAQVTVEAIVRAEEALRACLSLGDDTPVLLLGANGFIGRRVARKMVHRKLYPVDPTLQTLHNDGQWRSDLNRRSAIVLNLATPEALRMVAMDLWPEAVVLNEVYPEPDETTRSALRAAGCSVYHITGLRALSIPPFPKVYRGGIPCCAGRMSASMQPLITKLN